MASSMTVREEARISLGLLIITTAKIYHSFTKYPALF